MSFFAPDTPSTKMSEALPRQTWGVTSKKSSRSSSASSSRTRQRFLCLTRGNGPTQTSSMAWERTDGLSLWLGGSMTLSGGVYRRDENGIAYLWTSTGLQPPLFCLTLNLGETPRVPNPTKLSRILEPNPDPKYRLSQRACQGILNRAERRGKALPPELKAALEAQATPSKSGGVLSETATGEKLEKDL